MDKQYKQCYSYGPHPLSPPLNWRYKVSVTSVQVRLGYCSLTFKTVEMNDKICTAVRLGIYTHTHLHTHAHTSTHARTHTRPTYTHTHTHDLPTHTHTHTTYLHTHTRPTYTHTHTRPTYTHTHTKCCSLSRGLFKNTENYLQNRCFES